MEVDSGVDLSRNPHSSLEKFLRRRLVRFILPLVSGERTLFVARGQFRRLGKRTLLEGQLIEMAEFAEVYVGVTL